MFRDVGEPRFLPGELDPPLHRDFRAHLDPEVSPTRLRAFQDNARALAAELFDEVRAEGGCEFQHRIGHIMPIYNFLIFMGLPKDDAHMLLPHVAVIGRSPDPESFQAAMTVLVSYIEDRLAERQRTPTDDFLGRLLTARIGDRAITPAEVRATATNVLLGGLDTVTASMGFFMKFLAEHPDQRRALAADPALIPVATEELLRRHGIFNTARLVIEPFDFHGTQFRDRDLVMVPTALYNLDPARFDDPMTVDFARKDKGHFTFASGIHRCLGQNFARIQLHILLQEWLARLPDFAIDPDEAVAVQSGRANTVVSLPLRW